MPVVPDADPAKPEPVLVSALVDDDPLVGIPPSLSARELGAPLQPSTQNGSKSQARVRWVRVKTAMSSPFECGVGRWGAWTEKV
jgi:hypothetical protein